MIGGRVTETIDTGDAVWVEVFYRFGRERRSVYVHRTFESRSISPGDDVRWSNGDVLWSPACGGLANMKLKRVGAIDPARPPAALIPTTHVTESPE